MAQEEEVLGKAYDSRLMRRLLTYLRPYRWQVTIALVSILLKAVLRCARALPGEGRRGPLSGSDQGEHAIRACGTGSALGRCTGSRKFRGFTSACWFSAFVLEFLQTYFMQWTGQKVMFDLRSQIFRHLQRMHVGFYDKNPVGRLVTRVTTDVDALNEMFTSGVVSYSRNVRAGWEFWASCCA